MMQAIWNRRKSDEGGFTLVELLVVIAILGILAAVAVFAIGGTTGKAKTSACKSDLASVQVASDAYTAETGNVAAGTAGVGTLVTNGYLRTTPATPGITITGGTVSSTPAC